MKIVDLPAARYIQARVMKEWPRNESNCELIQFQGRALEVAELYWVTEEMTHVAVDASNDMPAFTLNSLMPNDQGFIFFATPLPPLIVLMHDEDDELPQPELPVDWLFWYRQGENICVQYGCTRQRQLDAGWEEFEPNAPFSVMGSVIIPKDGAAATIIPDTVESMAAANATSEGLSKMHAIVTLAATWAMMSQPTVAETKQQHYEPTKNEVQKKKRRPGTITTVSLRRMKRVDAEPGASGRKLTHQHIVRGHWKQQAYGPARSLRKPLWIPSYLQGPEGGELLAKERVMVWRR
jgi:hypothetical protein